MIGKALKSMIAVDAYLLVMLAASLRRVRPMGYEGVTRFVVLVPAHDEASGIESCLAAIECSDYPADALHVVVVADNCSDDTAALARARGATVIERRDESRRGKGHALNWALDRLAQIDGESTAVAVVDADCAVSRNFFACVSAELRAGAVAVQAAYEVSNARVSANTELRSAAFSLMNSVRPGGRSALGLSGGLLGTGMALDRALLERFRFDTTALTEDAELHLRLVRAGHRVAFRADASVRSDMPTGRKAMRSQQARWEGGRAAMFRRHAMPLLGGGLRERDGVRLAALVELLIPPTAMLTLGHAVALLASIRAPRETRRAAAAASLMHVGFVLGGLASVRTPASTYRALLASPRLIFEKVLLLGGFAARGAPTSWGRTQREPHR